MGILSGIGWRWDRRGTATIEFALILPIMVLLVMELADEVRRTLAAMDVDAVAATGAMWAVRHGPDGARMRAAMAAQDGAVEAQIRIVVCDGACRGLPAGRYVRVVAGQRVQSLFGALRPAQVTSTATVRIE